MHTGMHYYTACACACDCTCTGATAGGYGHHSATVEQPRCSININGGKRPRATLKLNNTEL